MPWGLIAIKCSKCRKYCAIEEKHFNKATKEEILYNDKPDNFCDDCRENKEEDG